METEYSILLIPNKQSYKNMPLEIYHLSNLIDYLSKKYNCPSFPPHVTLIGKIFGNEQEIISKTKDLASQLSPFYILLNDFNHFNSYYKCLFLKTEKTKELINSNKKAKKIFNKKYYYYPHLSLMYGKHTDFPKKLKEEIIEESKKFKLPNKIHIDSLSLYSTTGSPKDWYEIANFAFNVKKINKTLENIFSPIKKHEFLKKWSKSIGRNMSDKEYENKVIAHAED